MFHIFRYQHRRFIVVIDVEAEQGEDMRMAKSRPDLKFAS